MDLDKLNENQLKILTSYEAAKRQLNNLNSHKKIINKHKHLFYGALFGFVCIIIFIILLSVKSTTVSKYVNGFCIGSIVLISVIYYFLNKHDMDIIYKYTSLTTSAYKHILKVIKNKEHSVAELKRKLNNYNIAIERANAVNK